MRRMLTLAAALLPASLVFAGGGVKIAPALELSGAPLAPSLGGAQQLPALDLAKPAIVPGASSLGVSLPDVHVPGQLSHGLVPRLPAPYPGLARPLVPAQASLAPKANGPQQSNGPQRPRERLIDSLSGDVPLMADENAGSEDQASQAEDAFTQKAGGKTGKRKKKDPDETAPPVPPGPPAPPEGDDGGGPNYPRDSVRFRGGEYPTVAFRPNVPVEALLIQAIDSARKSLHIAVYEFKLSGVLEALQRARERGVEIKIVIDYSNTYPFAEPDAAYQPKRSKELWTLLREGFDVQVLRGTGEFGINHNKFVIVDHGERESLAEFGSFNWSWSAENEHYENANFSTDKTLVADLKNYWDYLYGLSQNVYVDVKTKKGLSVKHVRLPDSFTWPTTVPPPPPMATSKIDFNGAVLPGFIATPTSAGGETFEDHMVKAISKVQKSLDISIFALRSTRIAEAVKDLHTSGKRVRVIIDEGQSVSEAFDMYAQYLAFHGVEVRTLAGPNPNSKYPYAQKNHNKFSIFDGRMVETGSANYTKYAAIANFENAHFLMGGKTAAAYTFFFEHMWKISKPFAAPAAQPTLPSDSSLETETRKAPKPRPAPVPHPGPGDGVQARKLDFHGKEFPSYAFRPDTPIELLMARAIEASQKSIRLALYEFNLEDVLEALRAAKKRGVKIELVIDKKHVYTSGRDHTGHPRMPSEQIQALVSEGFDLLILKGEKGGIMHNKYAVFDAELPGAMVVFGSYNWAVTAERNHYENVRFSTDKFDVADYKAYFEYKRGLAEAVDPKRLEEILAEQQALGVGPAGVADLAAALDAGEEGADEASPQEAGVPDPDKRGSKNPPPPESTAPRITFNGEEFHRHYFSPEGGIAQAWIRAIKAARSSIDIAMFVWWSQDVAEALLEARKQNPDLKIRILLDAGQGTLAKIGGKSAKEWFVDNGFDIKLIAGPNADGDPMFEKQHNKFMNVDGALLLTGSFNLSPNAEKFSFENENLTEDAVDILGYSDFFSRMWAKAWSPQRKTVPRVTGNGKRLAPLHF